MELLIKCRAAREFAIQRHGDQKRQFTGEPYWHQPVADLALKPY